MNIVLYVIWWIDMILLSLLFLLLTEDMNLTTIWLIFSKSVSFFYLESRILTVTGFCEVSICLMITNLTCPFR